MKIFPTQETTRVSGTKSTGGGTSIKKGPKGKKHAPAVEKQPLSENEIREKLAAHVETSNTAKSVALKKNAQKLGDGFMNPEMKPQPKAQPVTGVEAVAAREVEQKGEADKNDHLLKTDINFNDPKDPATQEKLKTVLSNGAFNFNARERETLDKILNGN